MELHRLKCKINTDAEKRPDSGMRLVEEKKAAKAKQKKKKKKVTNTPSNKDNEEDIDTLIDEFTKIDSVCRHDKCKTTVLTLGQHCKFCGKTFCLKHGLAEVHGCGEAAKIDARDKARQYQEKGPSRKSDEIKKKHIKRKLDKKISDMESTRTRPKDKGKDR